jgi:small subunit ribosomal protein S18
MFGSAVWTFNIFDGIRDSSPRVLWLGMMQFHVRTLPKVPAVALKQFREEVPAGEADTAQIASTRGVWDAPAPNMDGGRADGDSTEMTHADLALESAWSAVDERTMDPYFYSRMRRQRSLAGNSVAPGLSRSATSNRSASFGRWGANGLTLQKKRRCRLSDPRGRVRIDFREVGVLESFINEHGKIIGRRKSALSAKAQRKVARCVKTARRMALLHPEPKPGLTLQEMEELAFEMGAEIPVSS